MGLPLMWTGLTPFSSQHVEVQQCKNFPLCTLHEEKAVLYADDMLLLKPFRNYNDYKYFQDDVNAVHNHNIATRLPQLFL